MITSIDQETIVALVEDNVFNYLQKIIIQLIKCSKALIKDVLFYCYRWETTDESSSIKSEIKLN